MKKWSFVAALMIVLAACTKEQTLNSEVINGAPTGQTADLFAAKIYPGAPALRQIIDSFADEGLPGISLAVYSPAAGAWIGTSGFAKTETRQPMRPVNLQYAQSITKTYMATAILQLYEAGKLQLDAPIKQYLAPNVAALIKQNDRITVRMLLNHTSGIPDYSDAPAYLADLAGNPLRQFTSMEYLGYIANDPLLFTPGSKYTYSNTNYLLLALLADNLTGNHVAYIKKHLLEPLNLKQTFYHTGIYLQSPLLVNTYLDPSGSGHLRNVTAIQKANVNTLYGDDGLIAGPADYIRFLHALFSGKILRPATLELMRTWVNDAVTSEPAYGMGLSYLEYNGYEGWGHGGAGIGTACALYYFPGKNLYLFLSVNLGPFIDGPLVEKTDALKAAVLQELLK